MATAIASIPVLTGDVAAQFEKAAESSYESFLNRTPEEEAKVSENYDKGIALVHKILAKSKLM